MDPPHRKLAVIEALVAEAEAELARLRTRERPPATPDDVADPVRCHEIWLAALLALRADLLSSGGDRSADPMLL